MDISTFLTGEIAGTLMSSIVLVAAILLIRVLTVRALHGRAETLTENARRWISIVQNTSVLLVILGLIFIWSPQLSAFALSIAAFAVALAILSKEFMLNLVGAAFRAFSRSFDIGDWIEVGDFRGEVISEGMLTTRLQELGEGARRYLYTGRVVAIPNNYFLVHTVRNETFRKRFIHHTFNITLEPGPPPQEIKDIICRATGLECSDFMDVAERYWSMIRRKARTELPAAKPSVYLETTDFAKLVFVVTVFCPTQDARDIEERITSRVMGHLFGTAQAQPTLSSSGVDPSAAYQARDQEAAEVARR